MSEKPSEEEATMTAAATGEGDGSPTDKKDQRPSSGGRKSLEGLSPQQDAKVGTLKQMFQDYDNEVLCSVLFEQCGGDLDKSIEAILEMQKVQNAGGGEAELKDEELASSLVEPEEGKEDKPAESSKASAEVD